MAMLSADAMWGVPNCCSFLRVQSLTTLVTHAILCPVGIHWQKNASLGPPRANERHLCINILSSCTKMMAISHQIYFFSNTFTDIFKMVYFISTREIQFHSISLHSFKNVDSKIVNFVQFNFYVHSFGFIIIFDFSLLFYQQKLQKSGGWIAYTVKGINLQRNI